MASSTAVSRLPWIFCPASSSLTMAPNSSFPFGGYSLFGKDSPIDITASSPLSRPSHLSYYVAVACVLFVTFLLRAGKRKEGVDAPFYKASKMKWMFDAETLVRDSYNKVDSPPDYGAFRESSKAAGC